MKIIWVAGGGCIAPLGISKFRWEGTVPLNETGSISLASWGTGCRDICGWDTPDETSKSASAVLNGNMMEVSIEGGEEEPWLYLLQLVDECPSFPTLPECTSCDECEENP